MAAELYSPYLGVTEANISQLFQRARANVPAVLFIDEIGNKQTIYYLIYIKCFPNLLLL
jgi:AAA+ superfamily predicted ATPase